MLQLDSEQKRHLQTVWSPFSDATLLPWKDVDEMNHEEQSAWSHMIVGVRENDQNTRLEAGEHTAIYQLNRAGLATIHFPTL